MLCTLVSKARLVPCQLIVRPLDNGRGGTSMGENHTLELELELPNVAPTERTPHGTMYMDEPIVTYQRW